MEPLLRLERRGAIAVLTIARPPANALNHALFRELLALLPQLHEASVRAVVLTGQGRFFSAGLDLFEVFGYSPAQGAAFASDFDDAIAGLFALPKPLVAAINGHAVAGGTVLAATADFRLLAEGEAKLGITEILVGVPFPTSALEAVRYSCAGPYLHELFFRGQTYPVAQAVARRLADEVCASAELLPRAFALAEELAAHPAQAFSVTKLALRAEAIQRMKAARAAGEDPVWAVWRTPETIAAMTAYRERIARGRK